MRFSLLELVSIRLEYSFTAYALLKERFNGVKILSTAAMCFSAGGRNILTILLILPAL